MNSLVSIIVPIFNVENYLAKCIMSIRNQTYKNLEIILVNDGSTDNSLDICKKYARLDNRIKLFNQKNGGLSKARNTGINNAHGDFYFFVDSDDYIHPMLIEELLKLINYNVNISLAICNYSSKKINNLPGKMEIWDQNQFWKNYYGEHYISCVVAWGKLYSKKLFDSGIRFDEGKLHEDEYILHKVVDQCELIAFTDKPLYFYSIRENSITHSESIKSYIDKLEAFILRTRYFASQKSDVFLGKAINSDLFMLWKIYENDTYNEKYCKYKCIVKALLNNVDISNINFMEKIKIQIFDFNDTFYYKLLKLKNNF